MERRSLAAAALAGGIVLALVAILADTLGIGGEEGFGWKQAVLLAVGLVLALLGAGMLAGVLKLKGAPDEDRPGGRSGSEDPLPPPD